MESKASGVFATVIISVLANVCLIGCGESPLKSGGSATPPAVVERATDADTFKVDHPDQFQLVNAAQYLAAPTLSVTGTVSPDVSRTVPVISLAAGRVVEIRARLGDSVEKGQVLLRVQSPDIASAFSDYRKAIADEALATKQFERARDLYDKGAISLNEYQVAEDANQKAKVDVETTLERLHVLGVEKDHPSGVVEIKAPISGVITDQQVTNAAGVQGLSGSNPFTISDLSNVWILCDVYENDLRNVHVGEMADVTLNAYPDRKYSGKISNVGPILDPNARTAKVRIQVPNPGRLMRVGMFVTATFHGQTKEEYASVPSSAIVHLHDHDWVYVPAGENKFRRVAVRAGNSLPNNMQEIREGIKPGQEVVASALTFQNVAEQ